MYWSADGQAWLNSDPGIDPIIGASWNGGFYVVSAGGARRTADGINWLSATHPFTQTINSNPPYVSITEPDAIFSAGPRLVAVVWTPPDTTHFGRTLKTSNDGVTWATRTYPPVLASGPYSCSAYAGGKFFLFGGGAQYAVTSDFVSWQVKSLPYVDIFEYAMASPDGTSIAVIGSRQQAAVCQNVAAETWAVEPLPFAATTLKAVASTPTNLIAVADAQCAVRDLEAAPPPNASYDCVNGVCTQVTGLQGQYRTLGECQRSSTCAPPPPPANPTSAFKVGMAWRHENVDWPAAAGAGPARVSFNVCRVSWPAGSISFSNAAVQKWEGAATPCGARDAAGWYTIAGQNDPAQPGFVRSSSGLTLAGSAACPFSFRVIDATTVDLYVLDRPLTGALGARRFVADNAGSLTSRLSALGLSSISGQYLLQGSSTVAMVVGDASAGTRSGRFRLYFNLTTGGTHVAEFTPPPADIGSAPGSAPQQPLAPTAAPSTVTVSAWQTVTTAATAGASGYSAACWDTVTATWQEPPAGVDRIKIERRGTNGAWTVFPVSPTTCPAGMTPSSGGRCAVPGASGAWFSYRPSATTPLAAITIYKHNTTGSATVTCRTRASLPSFAPTTFRVSFGSAAGYGPATEFTVTP